MDKPKELTDNEHILYLELIKAKEALDLAIEGLKKLEAENVELCARIASLSLSVTPYYEVEPGMVPIAFKKGKPNDQ